MRAVGTWLIGRSEPRRTSCERFALPADGMRGYGLAEKGEKARAIAESLSGRWAGRVACLPDRTQPHVGGGQPRRRLTHAPTTVEPGGLTGLRPRLRAAVRRRGRQRKAACECASTGAVASTQGEPSLRSRSLTVLVEAGRRAGIYRRSAAFGARPDSSVIRSLWIRTDRRRVKWSGSQ